MNKTELAKKLAIRTELSDSEASRVVDAIFSTAPGEGIIATELEAGRKVTITGFGTFETRQRKARQGRNPATGETIHISAKEYAHFRPGAGLKAKVGGGPRRPPRPPWKKKKKDN